MTDLLVLIIDDEPALREILSDWVRDSGRSVETAAGVGEARSRLARGDVDVALCDIKLPDGSGLDLLRESQAAGLDTAFVMLTAFGSVQTAVEALRSGAHDYVTKPLRREELLHRLEQIASVRGLRQQNRALRKAVVDQQGALFRFASPSMVEVDRLLAKVAPTDSTVLVTGESGTGKGVVARRLHEQSPRAEGPFVAVNCGAIPENLLESEFFGHVKGSFTGADRARKGLFLQADRGTLFLDEIGEMPLQMQTKLLHVIEDREVRPLGSEQSRRVDVRIVAATNRDLQAMVRDGRFREDLYFRLSVFRIHVPPLRERREDIPALARHVLRGRKAGSGAGRIQRIDAAAEDALLAYPWPGNVRELENVMIRANIIADGDCITLADLPPEVTPATAPQAASSPSGPVPREARAIVPPPPGAGLRDQLRQFEAGVIRRTLDECGGDRRLAALRLGIGLSSLYRKLEEFDRDEGGRGRAA